MIVQILINGLEMCALLDSGASGDMLPLYNFNSIPSEPRPPIEPSTIQVLQGIVLNVLVVLREDFGTPSSMRGPCPPGVWLKRSHSFL